MIGKVSDADKTLKEVQNPDNVYNNANNNRSSKLNMVFLKVRKHLLKLIWAIDARYQSHFSDAIKPIDLRIYTSEINHCLSPGNPSVMMCYIPSVFLQYTTYTYIPRIPKQLLAPR